MGEFEVEQCWVKVEQCLVKYWVKVVWLDWGHYQELCKISFMPV